MGTIQKKDASILVSGEANVALAAELQAMLAQPPAAGFAVDLSAATRIDSSIIQLLVAASRSAPPIRIVALSTTERERWERLGIAAHLLLP